MSNWTQPLCGECWYKDNPSRIPSRLREPETEMCCKCGNKTESGIYIRVDPELVPYPTKEAD